MRTGALQLIWSNPLRCAAFLALKRHHARATPQHMLPVPAQKPVAPSSGRAASPRNHRTSAAEKEEEKKMVCILGDSNTRPQRGPELESGALTNSAKDAVTGTSCACPALDPTTTRLLTPPRCAQGAYTGKQKHSESKFRSWDL
jgi:hypothetical protein